MVNPKSTKVLVTGANGFIGRAVVCSLSEAGYYILAASRYRPLYNFNPGRVEWCVKKNLTHFDDLSLFENIDCVVHLAGRAHVLKENASEPEQEFLRANRDMTHVLSKMAARCGVKRFIFLSTIGVHGNNSGQTPFSMKSSLNPYNYYTYSKFAAEQCLSKVCHSSSLETTIIRPPLVYGPHTKGNFLSMLNWLDKGIPLPFDKVDNRRSMVSICNLVDLIVTCINHPAAANQTFLVSDGEDLSTTELLRRMSNALGKPVRLFAVSPLLFKRGAELLGKKDIAHRLLGNLQVDITHTQQVLDWSPSVSVEDGLNETAYWYKSGRY